MNLAILRTSARLAAGLVLLAGLPAAAPALPGEDRSLPFNPPGRGGQPAAGAPAEAPKAAAPVLVVYPIISAFDKGELGASVKTCVGGHALRGKLASGFDALTEGEILARAPFRPETGTPLADVARHARDNFKAAYAVWGEISRKEPEKAPAGGRDKGKGKGKGAPGDEGYTLRLLGARVGEQDAELAVDETYDCPNVHFIPQHVETFLAKLFGTERRDLERKWPKVLRELDPELCANGDFAKGRELPEGWTVVRDDVRDQVAAERRPGGAEADRCLAYRMKSAVADSSGIAVLSAEIPVEEGAFYRVGVDILSKGPKVIIFVKGYASFGGELREVYNHQARYYPEKPGDWERKLTEAFRPRHPWLKVEKLRVMLYAYHPAGDVFFDNASVRKVEVEPVAETKLPYKKEGGGADQ
ncbi:MAG TPA: hypothetical protein PK280_01040 [Planctomycetota bacterium]|nr:hypothetical protein [Planctomycetota bacterium]